MNHAGLLELLECVVDREPEWIEWVTDRKLDLRTMWEKFKRAATISYFTYYIYGRYHPETYHKKQDSLIMAWYERSKPKDTCMSWRADETGEVCDMYRELFPFEMIEEAAKKQLEYHRSVKERLGGPCYKFCDQRAYNVILAQRAARAAVQPRKRLKPEVLATEPEDVETLREKINERRQQLTTKEEVPTTRKRLKRSGLFI